MPSSRPLAVHLVSVNPPEGKNVSQTHVLRKLWEISDQRHSLVTNADVADICILCDLSGPGWYAGLRSHPLVAARPDKCFAVHDGDVAMPLLHGVYTSAVKSMRTFRRFRGGAYNLFPSSTRNPFIENCDGDAYLKAKNKLVSFWGQDSSNVRLKLFQLSKFEGIEIVNTTGKYSAFVNIYPEKASFESGYYESLESSKFALCPRGKSPASIRLFEAMRMGVAPVIISDDCLLPTGPQWDEFALFVNEVQVDEIVSIVKKQERFYREKGRKARLAYENYFADKKYFNYLVDQMMEIKVIQVIPERIFWLFRNLKVKWYAMNGAPGRN